jgi:hypothetical protein
VRDDPAGDGRRGGIGNVQAGSRTGKRLFDGSSRRSGSYRPVFISTYPSALTVSREEIDGMVAILSRCV